MQSGGSQHPGFGVRVYSPNAVRVRVRLADGSTCDLRRDGEDWVGEVPDGSEYGLLVDGSPAMGFQPHRGLVDPSATAVCFPPGYSRTAARRGAPENHATAPRALARRWPASRPARATTRPLVVYETHVGGMTRRRDRPDAGTFRAMIDELPRLRDLGVSVIELLPVHQFDPDEQNYWGYMPLVFGAVHRQYAAGPDAAEELADLVSAAHDLDIEVWLDVVFNHTSEDDPSGPTTSLRGLADREYYVHDRHGHYVDETGCGNTIDVSSPAARVLIMTALDRFAGLGVDGFRFDLASVLTRDPTFVRSIGDWARRRRIRLIAEPWDITRYQVGRTWPDRRWHQWNDRFRDDMRSFLRGEPGTVRSVMLRLEGSPDLFDGPDSSVNFLTAHDGFTMYDLVAYDRKHNDANGEHGRDGSDDNRSWNCGHEGDVGASRAVMKLRRRQLRNAWCLLMLSLGTPMFVGGDEFGRTQGGNNNPYNQDNETTWVDWDRRAEWGALERFVGRLVEFRGANPVLCDHRWWGDRVEWFGVDGSVDLGHESRALAWHLPRLYVMANMWWEPLRFSIQEPGPWTVRIDTTDEAGFVDPYEVSGHVTVGPRSIVVLTSED